MGSVRGKGRGEGEGVGLDLESGCGEKSDVLWRQFESIEHLYGCRET